ncbi:LysR family transcriptional regulator [Permianibacter fluminis]|uniref:LysR family transcriptional regulator n=1 Tax=Permianibacter fluminis TaxID=2738515 RepID=UPI001F3A5210|nr:LysR family transcriptional regulator [Permianibacter fluminis]
MSYVNVLVIAMQWGDVQVFLAVARTGSLGAAGRQLGLAQPTIGRRITALEQSVAAVLFQRSHTGLMLTDAGVSVLAAAERMEEEALHFQRRLAGGEQALSGLIRITASDWFGHYVLTPALAEFAKRHNQIEIELLTDSRAYDLARREADLAFRITPFEGPDIVSRRFLRMHYGLYAAAEAAPLQAQGEGARVITMNSAFGGMPDVEWLARHLPRASVVFTSNNREVQARACADGVGLAVLPVALAAQHPQLQAITLTEPPPSRLTWIGYHQDLRRLGRLRALLDFLIERFPPIEE